MFRPGRDKGIPVRSTCAAASLVFREIHVGTSLRVPAFVTRGTDVGASARGRASSCRVDALYRDASGAICALQMSPFLASRCVAR